jgi:hypothetical protein
MAINASVAVMLSLVKFPRWLRTINAVGPWNASHEEFYRFDFHTSDQSMWVEREQAKLPFHAPLISRDVRSRSYLFSQVPLTAPLSLTRVSETSFLSVQSHTLMAVCATGRRLNAMQIATS